MAAVVALLLPAWVLAAAGATAPDAPLPAIVGAMPGGTPVVLSMDEAVRAALAQHLRLVGATAQVQVAQARARQSRAPLLPQVDLNGRIEVGVGGEVHGDGDLVADHSASLGVSALLYDLGVAWDRYGAARASAEGAERARDAVERDLVLAARLAFIAAQRAQGLLFVAEESLGTESRRLRQIEAFVAQGTRPEIDVARQRTRVAEARAVLIGGENDRRRAVAQLARAMGLAPDAALGRPSSFGASSSPSAASPSSSSFPSSASASASATGGYGDPDSLAGGLRLDDVLPPALAAEDAATATLVGTALAARPDLAAAEADVRAQSLTADAAGFPRPALYLVGNLGWRGDLNPTPAPLTGRRDPTLNWNATAGLALSWPLFDGLAGIAAGAAEDATLAAARAQQNDLVRQVWLEVDTARVQVASGRARLDAADELLRSARELLRLAEARYAEGVADSLELADAQLAVTSASVQRVSVAYDLAAARAGLLWALGREDWR